VRGRFAAPLVQQTFRRNREVFAFSWYSFPMEYELAKQLQGAGFPQSGNGKWLLPPYALVGRSVDRVYVPTLEELIEACGGTNELTLFQRDGKWEATFRLSEMFASSHQYATGSGPTPSEAVANLYLALHKVQ
jgi:hypothetical protein